MASKDLVALALVAALAATGCATPRKAPQTQAPPTKAPGPQHPSPRPSPAPRAAAATSQPAPSPAPTQGATTPQRQAEGRASLASLIDEPCSWAPDGKTLIVTRTPQAAPVPLFRQAIVLAAVRSALADAPAPPKASFSHGLLTLEFGGASPGDIAASVRRAISVPEVNRLGVITGS